MHMLARLPDAKSPRLTAGTNFRPSAFTLYRFHRPTIFQAVILFHRRAFISDLHRNS